MRDISEKIKTLRTARAIARLKVSLETTQRIRERRIEKGDPVEVTKAVAVLSAKKTSEILPFCHNIPVDWVGCEIRMDGEEIEVEVTVKSIARTGCEMEALFAVSACALNLYDMVKPYDKNVVIEEVRLVEKSGGKSEFLEKVKEGFQAGVLVVSDSVFAGKKEDKAGKEIVRILKENGVEKIEYRVVPDEKEKIQEEVRSFCERGFDLVLATGGTGLSPRDVTPEAIQPLLEREIPAVMEYARMYGGERTPYAMLSRGVSGVRGKTVILTLPGSSRGARESMHALFPYLFHIYRILRGGGH